MPIGAFARRTGLTSSALRFYADSGLLPPAEVDPVTGYRFYDPAQVERARTLRRLREIAMPLTGVEAVLGASAEEAARLLDEHLARIEEDAGAARQKAAVVRAALGGDPPGLLIATVKGPVLADAVEQVLTATAHEPGLAVLGGLHIEANGEALALTATDRYRLSTRTLAPARPAEQTWTGTVDGGDLRPAAPSSAAARWSASRRCRTGSGCGCPDGRTATAGRCPWSSPTVGSCSRRSARSPPARRSRRGRCCAPWRNTPVTTSPCASPATR